MSRPRILSVGQCGFDGPNIRNGFQKRYDAEVVAADTEEDALKLLKSETFSLVMVNRVGDRDGKPGLDLIRAMKADAATSNLPVMLVSNLADAQAEAVAAGAVPGFGKADLGTGKERSAVEPVLAEATG